MNSDGMFKATVSTLERVKTIDNLTKQISKKKSNIQNLSNEIQNYGKGLLKNMTTKKVVTDIMVKGKWSEQKLVFANYGLGLQNNYSSNAISLAELGSDEFAKACILLNKVSHLSTYLKPEKEKILKRFLKNINKLVINRESQNIPINKSITYLSRNMLSSDNHEEGYGVKFDDNSSVSTKRMIKTAKIL